MSHKMVASPVRSQIEFDDEKSAGIRVLILRARLRKWQKSPQSLSLAGPRSRFSFFSAALRTFAVAHRNPPTIRAVILPPIKLGKITSQAKELQCLFNGKPTFLATSEEGAERGL